MLPRSPKGVTWLGWIAVSSPWRGCRLRFRPGLRRRCARCHPGRASLAAGTRHGLASHLRQYPDLALATTRPAKAAARLLGGARMATARWRDVKVAKASGFDTHLARRAAGDDAVGYLHAEQRRFSDDRHFLDPRRPEALIYATQPGQQAGADRCDVQRATRRARGDPRRPDRPLALPRRLHEGHKRGLTPSEDGNCPKGSARTQGSEMLHLWFTKDIRSAFAIHAPMPELCRDGVLSPEACRSGVHGRGM